MTYSFRIARAVHQLKSGGVIAYPTEAVWGLGCDPDNEQAVRRILSIKQRPIEKGMILVSGDVRHFSPWIDNLSSAQQQRLQETWPGPVTWLLPDVEALPRWVKGDHTKVALRVSAHPIVKALTEEFGGPIISTSANPAAHEPARSALRVRQYFHGVLDGVVSGSLGGLDTPTQILDIETGQTLRN